MGKRTEVGRASVGSAPRRREPPELRLWLTTYTLAAGFFVGMEWLFFVTKDSFLSVLDWGMRLRVFGAALPPLLAAGGLVLVALWAIARFAPVRPVRTACVWGMRLPPTLVLAASGLLLVDNFTNTLFGWGILSLDRAGLPYAAVALTGVVLVCRFVGRRAAHLRANARARRLATTIAAGVVALAAAAAALEAARVADSGPRAPGDPTRRPDILLLGLDGVDARHVSLYGYERPTAPTLAALAREAVVFTDFYSNAGNTAGALTAILTGRLPTDTRVIYAPDILRGEAATLHLPGILRSLGYRTGQFVIRHYGASIDFNMRGGFDVVNGRDVGTESVAGPALLRLGLGGYFLDQISLRLLRRVERLAGHRGASAFEEVSEPVAARNMDAIRIRELARFLEETRRPLFAHVHLMVTHGPRFAPRERHFSEGQDQTRDWMTDFYDDAILDADRSVEEILTLLRARGTLDRTLVIVYSDHTQGFGTTRPLPLLVRLPRAARTDRIDATVQSIDIAPTILDVLGLRPPPWMEGHSLLLEVAPCRPVFAAISGRKVRSKGRYFALTAPPFFGLGTLSLVRGGQWFRLNLTADEPAFSGGDIALLPGASSDCPRLTDVEAPGLMVAHLRAAGYDLPEAFRPPGDRMARSRQTVGHLEVRPAPGRARLADGRESTAFCAIENWGPRETRTGVAVNQQPDGSIGIWIRTPCSAPAALVRAGDAELETTVRAGRVTARLPLAMVERPGPLELSLHDPVSGESVSVGSFLVVR